MDAGENIGKSCRIWKNPGHDLLVGGWALPLWIYGWWHSQYMEKLFQTTNQIGFYWDFHEILLGYMMIATLRSFFFAELIAIWNWNINFDDLLIMGIFQFTMSVSLSRLRQLLVKKTPRLALVGGFNHLEKYQSMGRIISYIMENKSHVWNHQAEPLPTEGVYIYWSSPTCLKIDHIPNHFGCNAHDDWVISLYLSVGGIPTPLKNMSSSDWIIIQTLGENKKICSKPPSSYINHWLSLLTIINHY